MRLAQYRDASDEPECQAVGQAKGLAWAPIDPKSGLQSVVLEALKVL